MCAMTGLNILPSLLWESVSEGQESGLLQKRMSLFNDSKESRYDIESSCKTQVAGAAAKLPKRTYSPINLFSYSPRKRFAFTLAEVLLTLGIIGVVAAMTMPALIANYQKKQTVASLKKAYTNLSQAVKLSELSNGDVQYWNFSLPGEKFFLEYLSQFITINSTTIIRQNIQYKYLNGANCAEDLCTGNSYITYIADGSLLMISRTPRSDAKAIAIDINGLKKPNTAGKDLFAFWITKYDGIVPFGFGNFSSIDALGEEQNFSQYDRDMLTGMKSYACNKDKKGFWCTALIMMDGWEIKNDYPW